MSYRPGYKFRVQSTRDSQNKEVKNKLFGQRFPRRTNKDKMDKRKYYHFLVVTFLRYVVNYLCRLTFRTTSLSVWLQSQWQKQILANQNNTFICELGDNTELEVLMYHRDDGAVKVKKFGTDVIGYLG